jgi:molybdopterin-synthase adenylyltransferase
LVGAGGIGSITAEGLTRLGVKNLVLIDHDLLSADSLNRWQGGRPKDVGKPKVQVLARRLRTMVPGIKVTPIVAPLSAPKALTALKACDVLIGAVDNHLSRYLLNRVAVQYLIPYLDAATVIITKGEGENTNSDRMQLLSRLAVVVPGTTACLDCSQIRYYEQKDIALHLYDPQTRANILASGYIKDHPEVASPAVMPLNMQAASAVLIELVNLVTDFHPLARYIYLDWLHTDSQKVRADSSNFSEGPSPDCLNCAGFLGTGDSEPMPNIDDVLDIDSGSQIDNSPLLATNEN